MDKVTQTRIGLLHPKLRDEVTNLINKANGLLTGTSQIRLVQGLRTFKEQDDLYAQGRTKPGHVVTNAKGGQSLHNYGVAFDFCLLLPNDVSWDIHADFDKDGIADWAEVVKVFKDAGWEWGGLWKFQDTPHLQKTFGHTWHDLLAKYNNNETFLDANGEKYVCL